MLAFYRSPAIDSMLGVISRGLARQLFGGNVSEIGMFERGRFEKQGEIIWPLVRSVTYLSFYIAETKHDGASVRGGTSNENARAKRRDTTTNGSFVQRERASDARDRHTSGHDKGKISIFSLSFARV